MQLCVDKRANHIHVILIIVVTTTIIITITATSTGGRTATLVSTTVSSCMYCAPHPLALLVFTEPRGVVRNGRGQQKELLLCCDGRVQQHLL